MTSTAASSTVAIIGGGVVGAAMAYTLAHRGVQVILLETDSDVAYAASGTNSGILHTGFDSTPGQLETQLILRSAELRPAVLEALGVPVLRCGAVLEPHRAQDDEVIARLAEGARANGVEVRIRADGSLIVPGESITDPVAFTRALVASAAARGAQVETDAQVVGISQRADGLSLHLVDGRAVDCAVAINCAGLYADEVARLVGDDSFEIYPRKGEFFVFELPGGKRLDRIVLPVPTKRTKGVLVFPTLDGKVIAGPTAVDQADKTDWSVRPQAQDEILGKAYEQYPALEGLTPIDSYAGLRPAGRDTNYLIEPSFACPRLINVAAIRSTGLTACLGIADYVGGFLPGLGVPVDDGFVPTGASRPRTADQPWWQRTAQRFRATVH
ncbi:MAG TPA: FAD-dependent oxidoreductase [Propionibacteriaceae bacterium]